MRSREKSRAQLEAPLVVALLPEIFSGVRGVRRSNPQLGRARAKGPPHCARGASTARGDAPIYDHAFPVWRDFDADYFEALSKPDGGSRFSPADIGALGDPCHR